MENRTLNTTWLLRLKARSLPVVLCWQSIHTPVSGWHEFECPLHWHGTHVTYGPPFGVTRVYPLTHCSQNWPSYSGGHEQVSTFDAFSSPLFLKVKVKLLKKIKPLFLPSWKREWITLHGWKPTVNGQYYAWCWLFFFSQFATWNVAFVSSSSPLFTFCF